MFTILNNGEVFSPLPLGVKDVLIAGGKIAAVSKPGLLSIKGVDVEKIDASGKYIFPGFIDSHVHILGGGGEGGPSSRAPEITLKDIITSGVTTVIGCLGTDAIPRHMSSLLAKARGLEEEGITTYIFSGSYEVPVKTISGSIRSDLVIIDKVIGAGEIAISDHRSSQPSFEEFARLAAECRVGGMLGGKAGVLHCHLGDGKRKLELILRLINETEIPPTQVIPTHSNRNPELLAEAVKFLHRGGYIDLTAGADPEAMEEKNLSIASSIRYCQDNNVPIDQITISSDSNGSMPVFDKKGKLIGLTISTQKSLLANFRYLIQKNVISMENAARLFSTNSAIFYNFKQKGKIQPGMDADMIILDKDLDLTDLFSKGKRMMAEGKLIT